MNNYMSDLDLGQSLVKVTYFLAIVHVESTIGF